MSDLTPQEFVERWRNTAALNERQSAQLHFTDVCKLLGTALPSNGLTPDGKEFKFEKGIQKEAGGQGYADVYYEGHFAIEYKAQGKDLNAAYQQLKQYRENLKNPPLLVVCDIQNWEIHTNFTNTESTVYRFTNETLPQNLKILRALFEDPERLHPGRSTTQVTVEAASSFKNIVDEMRGEWNADPERIAHFMTKLVFCLFAEDVTLLPQMQHHGIFSHIVEETRHDPDSARFIKYIHELFVSMANGGEVFMKPIPYFNGALFEDSRVEPLSGQARNKLADACRLNWVSVEPAIFGTLFERSLDPAKRAQLGAHYTSREDILLIVEPVLMQPLRREWEQIQAQAAPLRQIFDQPENPRAKINAENQLRALREQMLHRLRTIKVLDPACGSGNFLYVSLGLLLDLEKEVINHPLWAGMTKPLPEVHPRQLYGIEINEIAHALASIVVWIGYIQWKQNNGYLTRDQPILANLENNIRRMDAILAFDADGTPIEPEWPTVDVIVGNPPFLGGNRIRGELGDDYIQKLWQLYDGRIPGGVDLVCYWFENARSKIEQGKAKRAGLLATNSIRGGANREVLNRIKNSGDVFMAWADRDWVLDGAAVRVSMVGFGNVTEETKILNGNVVQTINADLTSSVDITKAKRLKENQKIAFQGPAKVGEFDIPYEQAQKMLSATNPSGLSNAEVLFPYINAEDIVQKNRKVWIISFFDKSLSEAEKYELPMAHVRRYVKPLRDNNKRASRKERWWQHGEIIPSMWKGIAKLRRYIVTPLVSKHRIFCWVDSHVVPANLLNVILREDDYFFGVLHSKIHEVWSLRMGTWLGKGNDPRYTPTTTFETFPFPTPPPAPPQSIREGSIAAAAKQLHEERHAWLNPAGVPESRLKDRTLTNLYNALAVFRGNPTPSPSPKRRGGLDAGDFAPRLAELHRALDEAVCAAYGWDVAILDDEEAILRELLALNLARAEA